MKKLASMILDVVDCVLNEDIDKLAELVQPLSPEANTAYVPSFEEQQAEDSSKHALVLWHPHLGYINKYANYNSELTELNMAFLDDKKDELPEEVLTIAGNNLIKAAENFGIPVPEGLEPYKTDKFSENILDIQTVNEINYIQKLAGDVPEVFAWEEERRYPIHDAEHVKTASAYFETEHNKMSIAQKLEFVLNTTRAAEQHAVSVTNTAMSKFASLDQNSFSKNFNDHITIRQSYLRDGGQDAEINTEYEALLEKAKETRPIKVAQILHEIDKLAGLDSKYGYGIEDPLLATLAIKKTAAVIVDGTAVRLSQLQELDSGRLTEVVGNGVISELKSDEGLDVLKSLPKPVRQEVIDLL